MITVDWYHHIFVISFVLSVRLEREVRLVGFWPVQRLLLPVYHPVHEKLGRGSFRLHPSGRRSHQHHRAVWTRIHTGSVFRHKGHDEIMWLDSRPLTRFCFTDSSNPIGSRWRVSVDGRSRFGHRGRLDVDRRFSVPLHKLGCRWKRWHI